jgi:branched-subunit amino acid ABC-type transport system permease component
MLAFIIVGLITGSIYGLSGVGLVLTYRTTGVFNFANGAISATAAYIFYYLHYEHGLAWPYAAVIVVAGLAVISGVVLELVFRPLHGRSVAMGIVATVGLLLALEGYLYLQFGDELLPFPNFLPQSSFTVSGVSITASDVITFLVGGLLTTGLFFFLRKSRLGTTMRGVVNSPALVGLTGTDPERARRVAWIIGSGFAALSGLLLAPLIGLDADLLSLTVVSAFGAAAIGLFSSLPLTYAGGIGIGIVASVATKYLTTPPLNSIPGSLPFIVLIVVLLVVPSRRFASEGERPSTTRMAAPSPLLGGRAATVRWLLYGLAALLVLVIPVFAGYRLPLITSSLIYVVLFASLSLLVNDSGQISLCQAAFVAVGATVFSMLSYSHGVPWLLALVAAGLVAVPVGLLVALPTARLSGLHLALVTYGFIVLMENVVYPSFLMFGSNLTVSGRPPVFAFITGSATSLYYVVLVVVVVSLVAMNMVRTGRFGRFLAGLKQAPTALTTNGLGVVTTRLVVFAVSAFFAGIAGGLFVTAGGTVSASSYNDTTSLLWLAVLAFGGRKFIWAAVLPALALGVVPAYVTIFHVDEQAVIFGLNALVLGIGVREILQGKRAGRRAGRTSSDTTAMPEMRSGLEGPLADEVG